MGRAAHNDLPPDQAAAVARLMARIGAGDVTGRPIPLDVPNGPPGARYLVAEPADHDKAPAVIYRHTEPGEPGRWRVVGLLGRDEYRAMQNARDVSTDG